MGGIGIWQLLVIFAIVILIFGTKRLRSLGTDLGGALKGFKKSMGDDQPEKLAADPADITKPKKKTTTQSAKKTIR